MTPAQPVALVGTVDIDPHTPYGPPVTDTFASEADRRAVRRLIRGGSRSFYAASHLLPQRLRDGAYALYGFCRVADDAVDGKGGNQARLDGLRLRLDRVYSGRPGQAPADRCLADAVRAYAIPRAAFETLLEGFQWDLEGREYRTLADLEAYAERVAGSVGAMMAALLGVRDPDMIDRACDLGVAMQLTNVARDVGEDARAGRVYLPLDWLAEAAIDPVRLRARPLHSVALGRVIARVLDRADQLYARADVAIACLPSTVRPAIWAARLLYAAIGDDLRRNRLDAVRRRARTSLRRKLMLLSRAERRGRLPALVRPLMPHDEASERALVRAVLAAGPAPAHLRPTIVSDVQRTIDILWILESRDRAARLVRGAA